MNQFTCSYNQHLRDILSDLYCTLAISTYQAGKVALFGINEQGKVVQLLRTFKKPMGIAVSGNRMALACLNEVILFSNHPEAAVDYPPQPYTYDAMFLPKTIYRTGPVDLHDLSLGTDGIYALNTAYSCIVRIDGFHSFDPYWTPWFISGHAPEDRCHLNGMALQNGKPKYVTAFNTGNSPKSWKQSLTTSGVIIDVEKNEVIANNLAMPHSPRLFYNDSNKLYFLQSADGEVCALDLSSGKTETILRVNAFVRGLAKYADYLFIGMSKLRKSSTTFSKLVDKDFDDTCGVVVVHEPTGKKVTEIIYNNTVEEIFDVQIIPNCLRPNILSPDKQESSQCISTREGVWWALPDSDKAQKSMSKSL